jgi:hypothetical protein
MGKEFGSACMGLLSFKLELSSMWLGSSLQCQATLWWCTYIFYGGGGVRECTGWTHKENSFFEIHLHMKPRTKQL